MSWLERLELPFHEMDALFHGPGWEPIPTFVDDVQAIARRRPWVFDSHGYTAVRDLVWSLADTVIWLDYSRPVVLGRVLRRSASRAWTREPTSTAMSSVSPTGVTRNTRCSGRCGAFVTGRAEFETRFADPRYAGLTKVRIRRPAAARWWLEQVTRATPGADSTD